MSIGYLDSQKLTNIANAIRTKNDSQSTYTPSQMPQAILDIPSPERSISQWKQVAVIDYDGTLIADYTRQEALALTALPTAPNHSQDELPLDFEAYNWTLAEIKNHLTNHPQLNITVGALYRSTDDLSHFIYNLNDDRLTIYFTMGEGESNRYVDWGDGNTTQFNQFQTNLTHTYSTQGRYHVKLKAKQFSYSDNYVRTAHGPEAFSIGKAVTSFFYQAFYRSTDLLKAPFAEVPYSGSSISLGASATEARFLEGLVTPRTWTSQNLNNNKYLRMKIISLPCNYNPGTGDLNFTYNPCLERIDIPYGCQQRIRNLSYTLVKNFTLPSSCSSFDTFSTDYRIEKIIIEEGTTELGNNVIYYPYLAKEVYLPSTLTSMVGAFRPCNSELVIWCYAQTPPTLYYSPLDRSNPNPKKIYVPYGTKSTYESTQYWSAYANTGIYEEMPPV